MQVGIQEELDLKGISHIGGPADAGKVVDLSPGVYLEHDHDVSHAWAPGWLAGCNKSTLYAGMLEFWGFYASNVQDKGAI